MKFAFVARHRPVWPTRLMCRLVGVSSSGFYEWLERPQSARSLANAQLLMRIRESFALSDQTYGSPRIWKDLVVAGERCGENRVARLMHLAGIRAQPKPRRKPTDAGMRPEHSIAPNVLDRDFAASAPNRKWAADFTYIWTGEGWLFLAVVVDLFSRRVVGWSMQSSMTAQLVLDALIMALWRRGKPNELLHHSDQGSQGGFNRSSQHLSLWRCFHGATGRMDASSDRARTDAISRRAIAPARDRTTILETDRNRNYERARGAGRWRVAACRHALVPSSWWHATIYVEPYIRTVLVFRRTRRDWAAVCPRNWHTRDRSSNQTEPVNGLAGDGT